MKITKDDSNLMIDENVSLHQDIVDNKDSTGAVATELVNQPKKKTLSTTNISQLVAQSINEFISLFITTFLISYIYSVSTNYMLNIGLFYVFIYLSMSIFYLIISKVIVKTNRVIFYRIALFVKAGFIVLIIFLGKELARYVMLAGCLYGLSEACYWSSYNIMKNELVRKSSMKLYSSLQQILGRIIAVVGPIVLGTIIDAESFITSAIIVAVVVLIQLIMSFFIKSNKPEGSCFNLKQFFKDINNLGEKKSLITQSFGIAFIYGITDVISPLNTILIMLIYNSNASLGIISAIASVVSILVLLFLSRFSKAGKNVTLYSIIGVLQLVVALMIVFKINKIIIIIYTLVYGGLHYTHKYSFDVCRNVLLKRLNMYSSIDEFQAMIETMLQLARITIFGIIAIVGALTYKYFGTDGLVLSAKILSLVAMVFVFVVNLLIGLYEKRLVKYNIL